MDDQNQGGAPAAQGDSGAPDGGQAGAGSVCATCGGSDHSTENHPQGGDMDGQDADASHDSSPGGGQDQNQGQGGMPAGQ